MSSSGRSRTASRPTILRSWRMTEESIGPDCKTIPALSGAETEERKIQPFAQPGAVVPHVTAQPRASTCPTRALQAGQPVQGIAALPPQRVIGKTGKAAGHSEGRIRRPFHL